MYYIPRRNTLFSFSNQCQYYRRAFLRDIFFFINQGVIHNYADGNTLSFIHANTDVLKKVLEEEMCNLIDFFFINFMKANLTKFQEI